MLPHPERLRARGVLRLIGLDSTTRALALTQPLAWGVLHYAFGALAASMERDGLASRSVLAALFGLAILVSGIVAPRVGRALDAHGAPAVMSAGALLGGVALVVWSEARGVLALAPAFVLLGTAHAMTLYDAAFVAVARASAAPRRALVAITTTGALASALFVPLTLALDARLGWRGALLALAAVLALVVAPLHASMGPSSRTARAATAPASAPLDPRLTPLVAIQAAVSSGASVLVVPAALALGHSTAHAAWLGALAGAAQLPGRWLLAARAGVGVRGFAGLVAVQALGWAAFAASSSRFALAIAGVSLAGAAAGASTLARGLWLAGERTSAASRGATLARAHHLARAVAPALVAGLWDLAGGPGIAFGVLAGVTLLGAAVTARRAGGSW